MAKKRQKGKRRARSSTTIGRQVVRKPRSSVMITGRANRANVNFFPTQRYGGTQQSKEYWLNRAEMARQEQRQREDLKNMQMSATEQRKANLRASKAVADLGMRNLIPIWAIPQDTPEHAHIYDILHPRVRVEAHHIRHAPRPIRPDSPWVP